jgi:hypothetical protein
MTNYYQTFAFAVSGTNIFVANRGGVYCSTNNGTSWSDVDLGFTTNLVTALAISGTDLFAGTNVGDVWRRPLSDMITGIKDPSSGPPERFALAQNYPNPFNPSTNIGYTIASSKEQVAGSMKQVGMERVRLAVYDLLGREVAVLVDGYQAPGEHHVTFDARRLASGIYFYRLIAGGQALSRKLVLLK